MTIELKPGGEDVPVTEENKKEYVDAVVSYRISKRVKLQFDAFMSGLLELIPADLLNVFDERELELLIGGMTEIDMYVPYLVLADPKSILKVDVLGTTGRNSRITADTRRLIKSSNGSGNASALGRPNANRGCCNSRQALREFLSMDSRTCRAPMGHDGLRLRNQEILKGCRGATHASTD